MSAGDHPAVKIITLLGKLQTQVKEEGQAEEHAYAKFTSAAQAAPSAQPNCSQSVPYFGRP